MQIEIMPGVTLDIDEGKLTIQNALKLAELPTGDIRIGFDLTLTDVIEKTEQKVQNMVVLRTK